MRGGKEKGKGNENSFNSSTFLQDIFISAHSSGDKSGKFALQVKQRLVELQIEWETVWEILLGYRDWLISMGVHIEIWARRSSI